MTSPPDLRVLLRDIAEQDQATDLIPRLRPAQSRSRAKLGLVALGVAAVISAAIAVPLFVTSSGTSPSNIGSGHAAAVLSGYNQVRTLGETQPSSKISVALTPSEARRLATIVQALPTSQEPVCHGGMALSYQVRFNFGTVLDHDRVAAYRCGGGVAVTTGAGTTSWRRDASCQLFQEVRGLLPAAAQGTRDEAIGCTPPGRVTGRFLAVGGARAQPSPQHGIVYLSRNHRRVATATVGPDGRFSFDVAVGTYTLTGRTPQFVGPGGHPGLCQALQPVRVQSRGSVTANVYCERK